MTSPFTHLRRNSVAYLALLVALGGTSYAAVSLPKNSVGAKQIKSNAVRSAEIKNGSIKAADLKAGTLPSSHVPTAQVALAADTVINISNFNVPFDREVYDPDNMHDPSTPTRLTVPKAGYYRVTTTVNLTNDSAGSRYISIQRNNDFNDAIGTVILPASAVGVSVYNVSGEAYFAAGEFVTVRATTSGAGGSVSVRGDTNSEITVVTMTYIGS